MLHTEQRNPNTMNLDKMSPLEIVQTMNRENANSVAALEPVLPQVAQAVEAIAQAFAVGGRLFYLGAGTSGRLAVADAAECPPTFGVPKGMVVAIIAGGTHTLLNASENIEDDPEGGITELKNHALTGKDVVMGISASGGAAFVCKAVEYAKSLGCVTVGLTSNPGTLLTKVSDIAIAPDTGAEVLTGSTRLKAGNAQKMVLNMITTAAMVRSGYVYENLMINLKPSNIKLRDRVVRIVREITELEYAACEDLLERSNWVIRDAIRLWKES